MIRREAFGQRLSEQGTWQIGFATAGSRRRIGWRGGEREAGAGVASRSHFGGSFSGIARRVHIGAVRRILGVEVTVAELNEAVDQIVGCVNGGGAGIWGFCNAHTANVAARNAEFRAALQQMIIFNDGIGVDLASQLLYGSAFPDNLNGTDLTPRLLDRLPAGTPVYLIGSPPGVAEKAAAVLEGRHGIRVVGSHHGFFAAEEEEGIAASIVASGARLVLVGMGNPRQEVWAARHVRTIRVPILCIGAFLDFSAGRVSRAPAMVRNLRLEWIYRLMLEPRRMARRYLTGNMAFLFAVLRQRVAQPLNDRSHD